VETFTEAIDSLLKLVLKWDWGQFSKSSKIVKSVLVSQYVADIPAEDGELSCYNMHLMM